MTDYRAISKDLYERFHDAFEKLYISELKDQLADKDEFITAQDHIIAEQHRKVDDIKYRIGHLRFAIEDIKSFKPTSENWETGYRQGRLQHLESELRFLEGLVK